MQFSHLPILLVIRQSNLYSPANLDKFHCRLIFFIPDMYAHPDFVMMTYGGCWLCLSALMWRKRKLRVRRLILERRKRTRSHKLFFSRPHTLSLLFQRLFLPSLSKLKMIEVDFFPLLRFLLWDISSLPLSLSLLYPKTSDLKRP